MNSKAFGQLIISSIVLTLMVLIVLAGLQWLNLQVGNPVDWFIGIISFWWLLLIVVVPWNIHFKARELLADMTYSEQEGLAVEPESRQYVNRWASWSLWLAIGLHGVSALVLYGLAASGVTVIGYWAAGATVLLTVLRPTVRGYQYVAKRLTDIQKRVRYPRNDVHQLQTDVEQLLTRLKRVESLLDLETQDSWAARHEKGVAILQSDVEQLQIHLKELSTSNQAEHNRLNREAQQAVAQISADGQFLNHVREIIRFVKDA